MMHHAALHWPDVADAAFWPLAIQYAVYILNQLPRQDTDRSPLELFKQKKFAASKIQDFYVWGCSVYVLDSGLAAGRSVPRWSTRSMFKVMVCQWF